MTNEYIEDIDKRIEKLQNEALKEERKLSLTLLEKRLEENKAELERKLSITQNLGSPGDFFLMTHFDGWLNYWLGVMKKPKLIKNGAEEQFRYQSSKLMSMDESPLSREEHWSLRGKMENTNFYFVKSWEDFFGYVKLPLHEYGSTRFGEKSRHHMCRGPPITKTFTPIESIDRAIEKSYSFIEDPTDGLLKDYITKGEVLGSTNDKGSLIIGTDKIVQSLKRIITGPRVYSKLLKALLNNEEIDSKTKEEIKRKGDGILELLLN